MDSWEQLAARLRGETVWDRLVAAAKELEAAAIELAEASK